MDKIVTIAYVDGYNLYHGIIDKKNVVPKGQIIFSKDRPWGNLLWLDLEKFINSYKFPSVRLDKIKFFEAPSYKLESLKRQQIYKNALLSLNSIDQDSFFGGVFKPVFTTCPYCCGQVTHYTEKRTDVSLAVELVTDFYLGRCQNAIIIGGDSDQLPAIEKIKKADPNFKIYCIFPPHRRTKEISKLVGEHFCRRIKFDRLIKNQFPDTFLVNGFEVINPN